MTVVSQATKDAIAAALSNVCDAKEVLEAWNEQANNDETPTASTVTGETLFGRNSPPLTGALQTQSKNISDMVDAGDIVYE